MAKEKDHLKKDIGGRNSSTPIITKLGFLLCLFLATFVTVFLIHDILLNYDSISSNSLSYFNTFSDPERKYLKSNTAVSLTLPPQSNTKDQPLVLKEIQDRYAYLAKARPALIPTPPANEEGLPYQSLYNVIKNWNPDDAEVPITFKERLQHFDYSNVEERKIALAYREKELPFKLYNVPEFIEASILWNDDYLTTQFTSWKLSPHIEQSKDNHFMFWGGFGKTYKGLKPPQQAVSMPFSKWLSLAKDADTSKLMHNVSHTYFTVGAQAHEHGRTFISRDLHLFSTEKPNFFITNPAANKGIQCRFGMRGIIPACHYDTGKNMVAMLRGSKRYILNPPRECNHLSIIADMQHPAYRHSDIDWSNITVAKQAKFDLVDAIDTIVHVGEVLYIPSYWFHYIVSLDYSIQCNSRSGTPKSLIGKQEIEQCFNHRVSH